MQRDEGAYLEGSTKDAELDKGHGGCKGGVGLEIKNISFSFLDVCNP